VGNGEGGTGIVGTSETLSPGMERARERIAGHARLQQSHCAGHGPGEHAGKLHCDGYKLDLWSREIQTSSRVGVAANADANIRVEQAMGPRRGLDSSELVSRGPVELRSPAVFEPGGRAIPCEVVADAEGDKTEISDLETGPDFATRDHGKAGSSVQVTAGLCGAIWSEHRAEERSIKQIEQGNNCPSDRAYAYLVRS